jgi:hypothetical protein
MVFSSITVKGGLGKRIEQAANRRTGTARQPFASHLLVRFLILPSSKLSHATQSGRRRSSHCAAIAGVKKNL